MRMLGARTAIGAMALALLGLPSMAQPPPPADPSNPAPGCTATHAQLEANKKVAML